ncbi:MAG: hypothetical protein K9N46_02480 [Candidatus Marinimicrobia bacterium]|nr:hypothetical protein [Candidatus Neomarinimicrobiota bacterium]MCF7828237.1 hypothetical protein [Candidatus Neomarinimicrobiota bacterium]MCF7879588.1 hypothetical protein [Candidatus Neomarinimicrobiota bacterium]
MIRNKIKKSALVLVALLVATGLLIPTMSAHLNAQVPNSWGLTSKIPEDADLILMQQEGVPPADVYIDALLSFKRQNYELKHSENTFDPAELEGIILGDSPLVFVAKKQVTDDLALEITANVQPIPGGGKMLASVRYAESVEADVGEWKQAKWTEGKAKEAFFRGLEALRQTRYDAVDFETGVVVTRKEK